MSRSIPVIVSQLGRQASPLAFVVLESVGGIAATNFIKTHFQQYPFANNQAFDCARRALADLRTACAHETTNLEKLLPTAVAFAKMLDEDLRWNMVEPELSMSHDELALYDVVGEYNWKSSRARFKEAQAALPETAVEGSLLPETTVEGSVLPDTTVEGAAALPEPTVELVTKFLREKRLEAQAKAIEEGEIPQGFEITTVEYNFSKPNIPGTSSTWSTFNEAERKVTFNCDEFKRDEHLSTLFARVLQDGFGDLKEKVRITFTPGPSQDLCSQDLCHFHWNGQLVHEFGARDAAEGIKLCRDAAAWHWLKLLLAKKRNPRPSPNIADATTTFGHSGIESSAITDFRMPEPFPEKLKDVVQKLEKAGFQKEASDFAEKAKGFWYTRLQDKINMAKLQSVKTKKSRRASWNCFLPS